MPNAEFLTLTVAGLADPNRAIQTAVELYGSDAATAVAWCALEARFAGREADYRFWYGVFKELDATKENPPPRKQ